MEAANDLCRMLDERGIKYTTDDSNDYEIIEWQGQYNLWWQFLYDPYEEAPYGELRLLDTGGSTHLTPAQAIAATVGARKTTTRNGKYKTKYGRRIPLCECCGYSIGDDRHNFCPKCGAEIVGGEK